MASKTEEIISLAEELLADIELARISNLAIPLKVMRLARLTGEEDEAAQSWLAHEAWGWPTMPPAEELANNLAALSGRKASGLKIPFAELDAFIDNLDQSVLQERSERAKAMWAEKGKHDITLGVLLKQRMTAIDIKVRVLGMMHHFVTDVYHSYRYAAIAHTIFSRYQEAVDRALAKTCPDELKKLPSAYERLIAGDPEAVRHAMATCRTILHGFADVVYPPREAAEGAPKLGLEHHLNRIKAFIDEHTQSDKRRTRLKQAAQNLNECASKGVHDEVTADEARALVLQTYCLLGELVLLPKLEVEPADAKNGKETAACICPNPVSE